LVSKGVERVIEELHGFGDGEIARVDGHPQARRPRVRGHEPHKAREGAQAKKLESFWAAERDYVREPGFAISAHSEHCLDVDRFQGAEKTRVLATREPAGWAYPRTNGELRLEPGKGPGRRFPEFRGVGQVLGLMLVVEGKEPTCPLGATVARSMERDFDSPVTDFFLEEG